MDFTLMRSVYEIYFPPVYIPESWALMMMMPFHGPKVRSTFIVIIIYLL